MSATSKATPDPGADELKLSAGLRDMVAGLVLLALGVGLGGSSALTPEGADEIDVVFDVLGALWLAWGAARTVSALRARKR